MARQYSSVVAACRLPGDVDPAFSGSQVHQLLLLCLKMYPLIIPGMVPGEFPDIWNSYENFDNRFLVLWDFINVG